jgi:geranylgeranyl diphosphate synthase type II
MLRPNIESALVQYLPVAPAHVGGQFNEALNYALFPGGKRLRPVLMLLGAEIVGGRREEMMAAATAVEYIHTSSLIFDDLPCMDDARERRGQTALHLRFGEGLSVLVALALMNASYGLIFARTFFNEERAIRAHGELVECIGARGMVAGQAIDLAIGALAPAQRLRHDNGHQMRNLKTSALMRLALRVGAILSGAHERQLSVLSRFADLLGDAYQMSDDLLDVEEDAALFNGARLATLALEQGPEKARRRVSSLITEAKELLVDEFGPGRPTRLLNDVADYIADRQS